MKNIKYIIFSLLIVLLINAENVKGLEKNQKSVFKGTGLESFINRDFILTYDKVDSKGNQVAMLYRTGHYNINSYYDINKEIKKVIFELPENLSEFKYAVQLIYDYQTGFQGYSDKVSEAKVIYYAENKNHYSSIYRYSIGGPYKINFNENDYTYIEGGGGTLNKGWEQGRNRGDYILIRKDGVIEFQNIEMSKTYRNIYDYLGNSETKIFYTNLNIYNIKGEIIQEVITTPTITTKKEENNGKYRLKVNATNLSSTTKILIKENEKIIREQVVDKGATSIDIYLDNIIPGNHIYGIEAYNNAKVIYAQSFNLNFIDKIIDLEDTSVDRTKIIDLNDFKINKDLISLVKNTFIKINSGYLGKMINILFIVTILLIIRKKV